MLAVRVAGLVSIPEKKLVQTMALVFAWFMHSLNKVPISKLTETLHKP